MTSQRPPLSSLVPPQSPQKELPNYIRNMFGSGLDFQGRLSRIGEHNLPLPLPQNSADFSIFPRQCQRLTTLRLMDKQNASTRNWNSSYVPIPPYVKLTGQITCLPPNLPTIL